MSWNVASFKLWAVVDLQGLTIPIPGFNTTISLPITFDVVQFTADFELNSIPKAQLSLALGRRADDVSQVAAIHRVINSMKFKLPISVYMQAQPTSTDQFIDNWPLNPDGTAKTFRVFKGYTTGCGYRKSMGAAEFVLYAIHWLTDLNFASAVSRQYQPLNPQEYTFMAAVPNFATGGATDLVPTTLSHSLFNTDVIKNDFWGYKQIFGPTGETVGGIKQWFTELSNTDLIVSTELQTLGGAGTPVANTDALSALALMEPIDGAYLDGVPLNLDVADTTANQTAEQIASVIAHETFFTMANHTMWDKIVGEFASQFMFSISPLVEKALVVPFIPGLQAFYTTVLAREYNFIELNAEMPRIVRGVAVVMGMSMSAGGDMPNNPNGDAGPTSIAYNTVGGLYMPRTTGQLLLRHAPPWLAAVAKPYLDSGTTVPKDKPVSNAITPDAGAQTGRNLNQLYLNAKTLWDKYAQALYMMEILRGRSGTLSGKLRFDIAPGSTIRIEGSEEPFIDGDKLGQTLYGSVLRVSISINAESQKAGTAFHIGHIRSEAENSSTDTSVAQHPLWKTTWAGAPLVRA